MWELDHKEGWAHKNWCFWIVVLEKTLGSPLNIKELKPVNLKGNQSWIFTGRTDAEAKAPILWPPDVKWRLIGKDPDAGNDWRQKEKSTAKGWDGWMASPTRWTWIWTNSRRQWRTGEPGILQSMGLQRVRHDLATEQQQRPSPAHSPHCYQKPLSNTQSYWCYSLSPNLRWIFISYRTQLWKRTCFLSSPTWTTTFQRTFTKWANHHPEKNILQNYGFLIGVALEDTSHAHTASPSPLSSLFLTVHSQDTPWLLVSYFNFRLKNASHFW